MNMMLILVVIVVIIIILVWRASMRARELAVVTAVKTCKKWDVQLLDDTVFLTKMKLSRQNHIGSMCLFREYAFDYSYDGVDRYKGLLQFNGSQFIQVISSDQKVSLECAQKQVKSNIETNQGNNIIDLNTYRTQQQRADQADKTEGNHDKD